MRRRWIRLVCPWGNSILGDGISIVHNQGDVADVYRGVSPASLGRIKQVLEQSNAIRRGSYWYVDWNYLPSDDVDHPNNVISRGETGRGPSITASEEPTILQNLGPGQGGYVTFQGPLVLDQADTLRYEDLYRLRDRIMGSFNVPERFWYTSGPNYFDLRPNNDEE